MAIENTRFAQGIFIRIFRAWSAQIEALSTPFPQMIAITRPVGLPDTTAPAAASLFELVEGHLGRRLKRECCCSQRLTSDETALLGLLEHARVADNLNGNEAISHGLPSVIVTASALVRECLAMPQLQDAAQSLTACPFARNENETVHGL